MSLEFIPFYSFLLLVVVLIAKIIALRKKGIQPGSGNGEKNKAKYLLFPVFFLVFLIWLFEIIRPAFHLSFVLLPAFLSDFLVETKALPITGAIFLLLGLISFSITLNDFGTSLRFGLDKQNQGLLVTTGIFSRSRNPFFLSLDFYFLGVALILPSAFHVAFTLAAIVGTHFFILKEERFLTEKYQREYLEYTKKVRRYF